MKTRDRLRSSFGWTLLFCACGAARSAPPDGPAPAPRAAARAAPQAPGPNDVVVAGSATLEEVARALRTAGAGGPWVAVLVGEPDPLHPLDPVRLRWADGSGLDLWRLREDQVEQYLRNDPRAHNGALASWRDGRFFLTHPSDTSESAPLDIPVMADQNRQLGGSPREGVLIFGASDMSVQARPVLTEAHDALQAVHYLVWMIGE